jgi:hypothetical protein
VRTFVLPFVTALITYVIVVSAVIMLTFVTKHFHVSMVVMFRQTPNERLTLPTFCYNTVPFVLPNVE